MTIESFKPNQGLTEREAFQLERRANPLWKDTDVGSFFASHEQLRTLVVSDPFSPETKEKLRAFSTEYDPYLVACSAISDEQPGPYEKNFTALSRESKKAELERQLETSFHIFVRMEKYVEEHSDEIESMNDEELYHRLVEVAFGSGDDAKISADYALSQRRGFRLGIVNFIEDRRRLSDFKKEAKEDGKAFAEKYLGQAFRGEVAVEVLPIGFVISLDENDYALISTINKDPKMITSDGCCLLSLEEAVLRMRVVAVNRGGPIGGIRDSEKQRDTRKHEVRHILFYAFHEVGPRLDETVDLHTRLYECVSAEDYRSIFNQLKEKFLERARNEISSYFAHGRFNQSFESLGAGLFRVNLRALKRSITLHHMYKRGGVCEDLFPEKEREALKVALGEEVSRLVDSVRTMRLVAENLYKQSEKKEGVVKEWFRKITDNYRGYSQRDLAQAMIYSTPAGKFHRLARFAGLDQAKIVEGSILKELDSALVSDLKKLLDLPQENDRAGVFLWKSKTEVVLNEIRKFLPPDVAPVLLEAFNKWREVDYAKPWASFALETLEEFVFVRHDISGLMGSGIPLALREIKTKLSVFLEKHQRRDESTAPESDLKNAKRILYSL